MLILLEELIDTIETGNQVAETGWRAVGSLNEPWFFDLEPNGQMVKLCMAGSSNEYQGPNGPNYMTVKK